MALLAWTPTSTAYAFVAIAVVYFVATTASQWHRLRTVPGPFLAGFTNLWISWTFAKGSDVPFHDLGRKYGHLVRVAPNLLFSDDPEQLRKMGGARSTYGKDTMYHASIRHPAHNNMFTTSNVAEHDKIKAKLLGPYSGRETKAMEPIVDTFVVLLVEQLRGKITGASRPRAVVDLARTSMYFTMDVITRLAFGKELGFLSSDSDRYNLLADTRKAVGFMWLPLVDSTVRAMVTSRLFLNTFGKKSMLGVIQKTCEEAVKRRYQPGAPDEKDLLGAVIREGFPEGECISEMMFALAAGSDTTGSTIRHTMLCLMTTPRVYQKLKETIAQALEEDCVSSPIKQEEARKLPYLQAIIYEGIRMRPATPVLFNKTVPPQGDTISGIFVPGGTAVGWNLFPMMRSPDLWGPDAEMFRPERFMEADESTRGSMERTVELTFGHGRFGCAGKPLAMMELSKVFFELFRHFDFQLVSPSKPWSSVFYTIFVENDFLVEITEA